MAIQMPTWTPDRLAKWATERRRWWGEFEEKNQNQPPLAHEVEGHFRAWAPTAFSLTSMMVSRLWSLSKEKDKELIREAITLAADGWDVADIEDRFKARDGGKAAGQDPAAILDKMQTDLALDMAAGRISMEEWAIKFQSIALARLSLPGADSKTLLAMLDRTAFANRASTSPMLPASVQTVNTSPIQAAIEKVRAQRGQA